MKFRIFIYFICIIIIISLQSTILEYMRIYNIKPNLIIVFVVAVALLRGNIEGAVIGFFLGLLQDIISGRMLGFYALFGLYLGLIVGSVNKRLYRENFLVIIFFTFISTVAYEWAVYFFSTFFKGRIDLILPLKYYILPEAIYNSIVSIIIYVLVIKMNDSFSSSNKSLRKY